MSDSHRPFGDLDSLAPDDLHREPTTDAPHDDADALDAWLNEITSSGNPDTRSGSGQGRPNARIDDHDGTGAASLIAAADRFHRRIEAAQSRAPRASAPDPHLWETIMERTAAHQPVSTSANPWDTPSRGKPARWPRTATSVTPQARHRALRRQQVWNTVANVGLVAAILLAVVGAWRIADGPGLPMGSNGDELTAPGVAMQPATPDATAEAVTAPPVATPAPATDCDFSADIPIFSGVDESPWDGTAVLLTTDGDLTLTCPEEPEPTVLASEVASAAPLGWPGIASISLAAEHPQEREPGIVNLLTGDMLLFGQSPETTRYSSDDRTGSPWIIGASPGDPAAAQLVDLRTMETRLLTELAGAELPSHGGAMMSTSDDGTTLVLGLLKHAHPSEGNATLVTSGLPGDLLVLDGSLDAASWVSAPDDFPAIVGFTVSPDGEHVALHGSSGTMEAREHVWSIIRLADGEEIASAKTATVRPQPSGGVWTEHGFAYINGDELLLLRPDANGIEQAVFQADGPLTDLRNTTNGSIVLVDQQWSDELATMVVNDQTPTFHAVDIATGEATPFTGVDISHNTDPWPYPERFMVTFEYTMDLGDSITYHVHDAVTGEMIDLLDDVPVTDPHNTGYPFLGPRSVVSSADGETEVIAFDTQHIYLMQVVGGEPQVRQITSPPGLLSEIDLMANMFLSPDGTLLSLTADGDESGTRWLLPIDGEPDEWLEVPKTVASEDPGYILFVPGTGD